MVEARVLERQQAVARYLKGESATAICQSLGHSREWFYKWLKRHQAGDASWAEERPRRPQRSPERITSKVEAAIIATRRSLAQRQLFCGAQAIAWELAELGVRAPSLRSISRVLERHGLVTRRRGPYVAKGTPYPALRAERAGHVHQTDFVGPCYLQGPRRFYSLHSVDLATGRCGCNGSPIGAVNPRSMACGRSGRAWGFRIISKSTTKWCFTGAAHIPAAWAR